MSKLNEKILRHFDKLLKYLFQEYYKEYIDKGKTKETATKLANKNINALSPQDLAVIKARHKRYGTPQERIKLMKKAKVAVRKAIKTGQLKRPDKCQECGRIVRLIAHHPSYYPNQWLKVIWLCSLCHSKAPRFPDVEWPPPEKYIYLL